MSEDEIARNRWLAITATRLGGAVMVLVGLLIVGEVIPSPHWAGYVILGVGMADAFVVPQFLARKWRSPKDSGPE